MAKGRILAIDDEKFFRNFYQDMLGSEGYHVFTASNGEEALDLLQRDDFDLVITDMHMPGMDGIETTERIRMLRPDQDVMVVSSQKDVSKIVAAMKIGVSDYLLKPLNPDEFLHVVGQTLFRQTLRQEHSKLVSENVAYHAILSTYRRCLAFLKVFDLDRLSDLILDTLMELLDCEGAVLWLVKGEGAQMRPHCHRGLTQNAQEAPCPGAEAEGRLSGTEPEILQDGRRLLLPLSLDNVPLGLVQLESPLGRKTFSQEDVIVVQAASDFAVSSLNAVLRYQRFEERSLRAGQSPAYHMAFFRDCLERELQKARRYGRSLSVLRFRIVNYADLRMAFRARDVEAMTERLLTQVQDILREADVMAMASPYDYYVLLPETDFWGALVAQRRIRGVLKGLGVAELKKSLPADVQLRGASMPVDGETFEEVSHVLLERLEALPHSLVQRLGLGPLGFWKCVEKVLGNPKDYRLEDGGVQVAGTLTPCEDGRRSGYFRMPVARLDEMTRAFSHEVAEAQPIRGVIFRSCRDFEKAHETLNCLDTQEKSAATLYLIGGDGPLQWDVQRTIPVHIDDVYLKRIHLLLYLTEDQAYALFAWHRGGELIGFHSADYFFVETMVAKLQEHYKLQGAI